MLKFYVAAREEMLAFKKDISGATAIEYGLIAAGIGIVILGGLQILGPAISDLFTRIGGTMATQAN